MMNMKNRKKLIALSLGMAIAMGVSPVLGVNAEDIADFTGMQLAEDKDGNKTGTITVNVNSDDANFNYKLEAYQVLQLVTPAGQNIGTGMTNAASNAYIVADAFDDLFAGLKTDYTDAFKGKTTLFLFYDAANNELELRDTATGYKENVDYIKINNTQKLDNKFMAASLIAKISNASAVRLLSDWINAYINAKSVTATKSATASTGDTSVDIEAVPFGYYAVRAVDNGDNKGSVINSGILNVVDAASVTLKSSAITVDKSVSNLTNTQASGVDVDTDTNIDALTATVGDKLQYSVETKVPDLGSYDVSGYSVDSFDYNLVAADVSKVTKVDGTNGNYAYCFYDTMTNQKVDVESITVTIGTSEFKVLKSDSKYYLVPKAATDASKVVARISDAGYADAENFFAINFNVGYLKSNSLGGKAVVVKYQAELMGEAGNDDSVNEAAFTYSNDPYDITGDSNETIVDTNTVYTYDLKVNKTFSDGSTADFAYVNFKLYSDEACTTEVKVVKTADGAYTVADSDDTDTAETIGLETTGGTVKIHGLGEGTYYLKEQESEKLKNDGYIVANVIKITVTANGTSGVFDKTDEILSLIEDVDNKTGSAVILDGVNIDWTMDGTNKYSMSFDVLNQKGFELPVTGESGNRWFAIIGIILVLGGGAVVILANRKKKDEA